MKYIRNCDPVDSECSFGMIARIRGEPLRTPANLKRGHGRLNYTQGCSSIQLRVLKLLCLATIQPTCYINTTYYVSQHALHFVFKKNISGAYPRRRNRLLEINLS
jgi:hypothetical protein